MVKKVSCSSTFIRAASAEFCRGRPNRAGGERRAERNCAVMEEEEKLGSMLSSLASSSFPSSPPLRLKSCAVAEGTEFTYRVSEGEEGLRGGGSQCRLQRGERREGECVHNMLLLLGNGW